MFGYASDETEDALPHTSDGTEDACHTNSMTTLWRNKLTDARKNGDLWWLRLDGTTRMTIEYVQRDDGSVGPRKTHTVVTSTQHTEADEGGSKRGGCGVFLSEETAPSMAKVNKLIEK